METFFSRHNRTRIPIALIFFVTFSPFISTVVCSIRFKKINVLCVFFTAYGPDKVRVDLHRTSGSSDRTMSSQRMSSVSLSVSKPAFARAVPPRASTAALADATVGVAGRIFSNQSPWPSWAATNLVASDALSASSDVLTVPSYQRVARQVVSYETTQEMAWEKKRTRVMMA